MYHYPGNEQPLGGQPSPRERIPGWRIGANPHRHSDMSVTTIKRDQRRELLVEIGGSTEKEDVTELKEDIKHKIHGISIRGGKGEGYHRVYMRDIDAVTNAEEMVEATRRGIDKTEARVKVIAMRPTLVGSQSAEVALEAKAVEVLISRARLKVGWIQCRVRRKVERLKCYMCWEIDHIARVCEDRGTRLRNGRRKSTARSVIKAVIDQITPKCSTFRNESKDAGREKGNPSRRGAVKKYTNTYTKNGEGASERDPEADSRDPPCRGSHEY